MSSFQCSEDKDCVVKFCVYKDYIFIQFINPYIVDPLSVPLPVYSAPTEPPSPASCSVESPGVFCCPSFPNDTGFFRCPQEGMSSYGHCPQHTCCGGDTAAAAPLSNPTRPQRLCLKTQAMLASPVASVGISWGQCWLRRDRKWKQPTKFFPSSLQQTFPGYSGSVEPSGDTCMAKAPYVCRQPSLTWKHTSFPTLRSTSPIIKH